jgi:hypothetical protein
MNKFLIPIAALALLFTGCDKAEPVTYQIPKEERNADMPQQSEVTAPAQPAPGKMQVMPGMAEAAQAAPDLSYAVPEAWEEFPAQSIRKANFRVKDASGSAEITVTVFPGDVGGMLGNINRWRGQIGLDAIQADAINEVARPTSISNHKAMLVNLQGPEQSVLGGILSFHGSTWFFKMQGATGTVATQAEAMDTFLASVEIEDHHH